MSDYHSEACRRIKEHTKIPWGELKLLAGIVGVLILIAVAIGFSIYWPEHVIGNSFLNPENFGLMFISAGILLPTILAVALTDSNRAWVASIFRRNLRHYHLRVWTNEAGEWRCQIAETKRTTLVTAEPPRDNLVFELPLGGWFGFAQGWLLDYPIPAPEFRPSYLPMGWRVRFHSVSEHEVYVEASYYNKVTEINTRLVLTVQAAISLFHHINNDQLGREDPSRLLDAFMLQYEIDKKAIAEFEVVSARLVADHQTQIVQMAQEREQLNLHLSRVANDLEYIERIIKDGDRFKSSAEAWKVRVQLIQTLLFLADPTDTRRHAILEDKLATAQVELEAAERRDQRNDRRRAGREQRPVIAHPGA